MVTCFSQTSELCTYLLNSRSTFPGLRMVILCPAGALTYHQGGVVDRWKYYLKAQWIALLHEDKIMVGGIFKWWERLREQFLVFAHIYLLILKWWFIGMLIMVIVVSLLYMSTSKVESCQLQCTVPDNNKKSLCRNCFSFFGQKAKTVCSPSCLDIPHFQEV